MWPRQLRPGVVYRTRVVLHWRHSFLTGFPKPPVVALNCEVERLLSKVWTRCRASGRCVAVVSIAIFGLERRDFGIIQS
jgi:hypothetical protein